VIVFLTLATMAVVFFYNKQQYDYGNKDSTTYNSNIQSTIQFGVINIVLMARFISSDYPGLSKVSVGRDFASPIPLRSRCVEPSLPNLFGALFTSKELFTNIKQATTKCKLDGNDEALLVISPSPKQLTGAMKTIGAAE
jgi:hypothetical protein